MKPKIVFIIILLVAFARLAHGQTIAELFVKLPATALLPLSASDRTELIDLYKTEQQAVIKNSLEDSCSILHLTDDYLKILIGKNTTELFFLPMKNNSKITGLIKTVCAPVCDSYIEFYTVSWEKLSAQAFITLANKYDFIKEGINPEDEKVRNALVPLDIVLMRLQYDPEKKELRQYYTTPDYLSITDRAKVKPYLKETPKLFKWDLTRFK